MFNQDWLCDVVVPIVYSIMKFATLSGRNMTNNSFLREEGRLNLCRNIIVYEFAYKK